MPLCNLGAQKVLIHLGDSLFPGPAGSSLTRIRFPSFLDVHFSHVILHDFRGSRMKVKFSLGKMTDLLGQSFLMSSLLTEGLE